MLAGDGTARKFAFLSSLSMNCLARGLLNLMRTVLSPTASIDEMALISSVTFGRGDAIVRSHAAFTAAAVSGDPSENFTPSRKVNSTVDGSGVVHFVARPGAPFPSGVLWIIVS